MYKLVASMLIAAMLSSTAVAAEEIEWIEVNGNDLDTLIKEHATKNWKPVFLLFTAPAWCNPCRRYESGALADSSVIKDINESFTPLVVYGNDRTDPDFQKYMRQYGVRGVPTTILMDPMGNELTRLVGPRPSDQILAYLDKVKNSIRWTDTVDKATGLGKKLIKPVIEVRTASDDYSKDLLFVMKKLPSLTEISSRFVWVESDADAVETSSNKKAGAGVYFVDPFTEKATALNTSNILLIKTEILEQLDKFNKAHLADGLYFCESCGKVTTKEECDDSYTKKIYTFKCVEEGCNNVSPTQKKCHGKPMVPVFKEE